MHTTCNLKIINYKYCITFNAVFEIKFKKEVPIDKVKTKVSQLWHDQEIQL